MRPKNLQEKMKRKSQEYQGILKRSMLPNVRKVGLNCSSWLFQQDNDPKHTSVLLLSDCHTWCHKFLRPGEWPHNQSDIDQTAPDHRRLPPRDGRGRQGGCTKKERGQAAWKQFAGMQDRKTQCKSVSALLGLKRTFFMEITRKCSLAHQSKPYSLFEHIQQTGRICLANL